MVFFLTKQERKITTMRKHIKFTAQVLCACALYAIPMIIVSSWASKPVLRSHEQDYTPYYDKVGQMFLSGQISDLDDLEISGMSLDMQLQVAVRVNTISRAKYDDAGVKFLRGFSTSVSEDDLEHMSPLIREAVLNRL